MKEKQIANGITNETTGRDGIDSAMRLNEHYKNADDNNAI